MRIKFKKIASIAVGFGGTRIRLMKAGAPVWGSSRLAWIGGNGFIAAMTAFYLAVTYEFWNVWTVAAPLLIGMIASWVSIIRPWVGVDGSTLIVVGQLGHRMVPLQDVMWVESGYAGLEIVCRDASVVRVWAVQESNLSGVYAWKTRSKAIAAEIQRLAELSRKSQE